MTAGTEWIDQARRLLDALRGEAGDAVPAEGAASQTHAADCRRCPICQLAAVVRGERPEVTAALADVLTTTAAALRAFAADGSAPTAGAGDASPSAGPASAAPASDASASAASAGDASEPAAAEAAADEAGEPPTVQRIEIA
jgi:hypothetical protein